MPAVSFQRLVRQDLPTIMVAAAGGAALWHFGVPAAWLSGAMAAVALMLPFGFRPALWQPVANFAMLLTGVGMGANLTPEMLAGVTRFPLSLAAFAIAMSLGTGVQYFWLVRVCGWDKGTAIFSAAPGAMSAIMTTAAALDVDVARVAMVQCVRLFILMAILPSLVVGSGAAPLLPLQPLFAGPLDIALVLAVSAACAWLLVRLRVIAPYLFGGMLGSTALHLSGLAHGVMPMALTNTGYLLIGAFVGVRFNAIDRSRFWSLLTTSVGAFLIVAVFAMIGAVIVAELLSLQFGKVMVAFAPGGVEAMIALSAALALDPLFAGAHHVSRFVVVTLLLPFFIRLARSRPAPPSIEETSGS